MVEASADVGSFGSAAADVTAIDGVVIITVGDTFGRRSVVIAIVDAGIVNFKSSGWHSLESLSSAAASTIFSMQMLVAAQRTAFSWRL